MTEHRNVDVLEEGSLFLCIATPEDIEHERQAMEAKHRTRLAVFDVETVTRSGTRCTRVTWQIL